MTYKDDDNDSYNVGYGKPPKQSQFKPGESGNKNGRPPKEVINVVDAAEVVFLTKERVKVNGEYRYCSGIELYYMKILQQALKSDKTADIKLLIDLIKVLKLPDRFMDS